MGRFFLAFVVGILTSSLALADDLPFGFRTAEGKGQTIQVIDVDMMKLAAKMGLERDDVILVVNDKEIKSKEDLGIGLQRIAADKNMKYNLKIFRPRTGELPLKGEIKKSPKGYYVRLKN